jgi:hypothetical protein
MSGSHLPAAAVRAGPAWQHAVAVWLPCAVPLQRLKYAVGTARRRSDNARSDRLSENRRRAADAASPRPSRQRSSQPCQRPVQSRSSLSERPDRRYPAASAVVSTSTVSGAEPPLVVFHLWSIELTFPSLLPIAGPSSATVAPPCQKNAAAELVFSHSPSTRSSGELSPSPPMPGR